MLLSPRLWQGPNFMNQVWSLGMLYSSLQARPAFAEGSWFAHFGFACTVPLQTGCSFSTSRGKRHSPRQNRAGNCQPQALGKFESSPSKSWDSFNIQEVNFTDLCVLSVYYLILKSCFQACPCPVGLQNVVIQNTIRRICSAADVQTPDF